MALTKITNDGVDFSGTTDINIDSGTFVVDASTDRVGIGTSSPGMLIHGANAGAAGLKLQNTTNSITSFLEAATSNVDFGTETNHNLDFYTNGSFRARLDTSGRLGIGTTSPDNLLEVDAGTGSDAGITIRMGTANSGANDSHISFQNSAG